MHDNLPDFTNKIILVYFESGVPNNYGVIENGRFEMQGENLFLVGRGPRSRMGWGAGVLQGIAWNKVQSYYVFDTVSDFDEMWHRSWRAPNA